MRITAILVLALAAVALTACGGSSKRSANTSSASPSTASTTTAATTSTTHTTTTSPATTTSTGVPPCTASRLSLSFIGQQGATGHGEIAFSLRNISAASCHTFGYPGVLFLDRAGQPLPTDATRTTHDFAGAVPEQPITLAPGTSASFRLLVTHGITSSAGCTTAYGLQAIPPDDTASLRTSIPGGAYECRAATVSPLQPGTTAFR
jgi:Domain of unknown function (DUF4232)